MAEEVKNETQEIKFEFKTKEGAQAADSLCKGKNGEFMSDVLSFMKENLKCQPDCKENQFKLHGSAYNKFLKKHGVTKENLDVIQKTNNSMDQISSIIVSDAVLAEVRKTGKNTEPTLSRSLTYITPVGDRRSTCHASRMKPTFYADGDNKMKRGELQEVFGVVSHRIKNKVRFDNDIIEKMGDSIKKAFLK